MASLLDAIETDDSKDVSIMLECIDLDIVQMNAFGFRSSLCCALSRSRPYATSPSDNRRDLGRCARSRSESEDRIAQYTEYETALPDDGNKTARQDCWLLLS